MPTKVCAVCSQEFRVKTTKPNNIEHCSRACKKVAFIERDKMEKAFIVRNWTIKSVEQISGALGINIHTAIRKASEIRKSGISLAPRKSRAGGYRPRETTIKVSKPRAPQPKPVKPPKQPKEKILHKSMRKAPRPEAIKMKNRVVDMTAHHFVKVDNKTWVLRKIA